MGDLSQSLIIDLHPLNSWTISPEQMVRADDLTDKTTKRVTLAPGQSRISTSFGTLTDGVSEGREFMQIGYNIYTNNNGIITMANQGIDNTANPYVSQGGVGPWTVAVDDGQSSAPAPAANFPSTPQFPTSNPYVQNLPQVPSNYNSPNFPISNNVDNSVTYTDNSVTNNYINSFNTDNSVNGSFNTDNSTNTYSLSYVTNANDYSVGKTISGNGILRGTAMNDLLTGGSGGDRLYGDAGNDELIGGGGKDRLYGGSGSNTFNAGTSKSRKDADKLYLARETNAINADIIESIGKSDRVYIQGAQGDFSVRGVDGGLGIFDNDVLQAIYTGNQINAGTLSNMLNAA